MAGILYLVGTPIGNLGDISLRALEVLRTVDLIAAEDTRQTRKLLNHFGLKTRTISYHQHNETERLPELLAHLTAGRSLALVTDAGMPGISDPGEKLVRAAREAGFSVIPVPGPAAFLLALAASGLPTEEFHFIGFLPRRGKTRTELLARLAAEPATLILYEAPHRLARTLADLSTAWGGERQVVVARELTKLYEEFWRGSLAAAAAHFGTHPVRGEITLVVAGRDREKETSRAAISVEEAVARIEKYRQNGESLREAIRRVAKETGWANNELYRHYLAKKKTSQRE